MGGGCHNSIAGGDTTVRMVSEAPFLVIGGDSKHSC